MSLTLAEGQAERDLDYVTWRATPEAFRGLIEMFNRARPRRDDGAVVSLSIVEIAPNEVNLVGHLTYPGEQS